MADRAPKTELDPRYSSDGATPTPWTEARNRLEQAKVYWISTVRPDEPRLRRLADAYVAKYDQLFVFQVRDGGFGTEAKDLGLAFELRATKAFGFGKGKPFSQTRYRFGDD